MKTKHSFALILGITLLLLGVVWLIVTPNNSNNSNNSNNPGNSKLHATSTQYAIATAHPLATEAGRDILQAGGNAFDAAVAISAALGVVEPSGSGFGGGGFWLLYIADEQRYVMIDGREKAPMAAHRDMYLKANGQPDTSLSKNGPLAAGIPGMPAAITHLAKKYGRLPLQQTLAPAIKHAENGFVMDEHLHKRLNYRYEVFNDTSLSIYSKNDQPLTTGTLIKQPDLANTIRRMAATDGSDFYHGKTAEMLVASVQAAGGIWSHADLASYQAIERDPIKGTYQDMQIIAVPPPSSGGIVLVETLNILEQFSLSNFNWNQLTAQHVHLYAEALRRSYRDRAAYLGDTDFVTVPIAQLTSQTYAKTLAATIKNDVATPSNRLPPVRSEMSQGNNTTHFSVVDANGNRVAATLSINLPFGSGFTAGKTGVLLNNEMDDFSIKPGTPNAYGLIGNEANAIEPGKRMLSSMSPTFVESKNGDFAILGTPGGSRIITMVLQGILGYAAGMPAEDIVASPRIHHQYLPDVISFEPEAISQSVINQLNALGHKTKALSRQYGNMQIITSKGGKLSAASDPRGLGTAEVGSTQMQTNAAEAK